MILDGKIVAADRCHIERLAGRAGGPTCGNRAREDSGEHPGPVLPRRRVDVDLGRAAWECLRPSHCPGMVQTVWRVKPLDACPG